MKKDNMKRSERYNTNDSFYEDEEEDVDERELESLEWSASSLWTILEKLNFPLLMLYGSRMRKKQQQQQT